MSSIVSGYAIFGNFLELNGLDLVGYNVDFFIINKKSAFVYKGIVVNYEKKKNKKQEPLYADGIYTIKSGKRTYKKNRAEFIVVSKN